MKLSVPTNFEKDFTQRLDGINNDSKTKNFISEVYGCLPSSVIGNLRPWSSLPCVSLLDIEKNISLLNKKEIKLNYTLNSLWLNKLENSEEGRKVILNHLKEINEIGVKNVTISIPWLIRFVKENFSDWKITASVASRINNFHTLNQFKDYGVHRVVIDRDNNRNFGFLRKVCSDKNLEIILLGTTPCIRGCAEVNWHGFWSSINSSCNIKNTNTRFEKPPTYCYNFILKNPSELLKIPWIRPEDLDKYSNLGVNLIKLDGRDRSIEYNIEKINAFAKGSYNGNLLYLLLDMFPKNYLEFKNGKGKYKFFINNKSLDNFITPFLKSDFCSDYCESCNYCLKYSKKVLQTSKKWLESERKLFNL